MMDYSFHSIRDSFQFEVFFCALVYIDTVDLSNVP